MRLNADDIKKIQDYFASQKNVVAVYLYGSFAKGTPYKKSDIDFGVLFDSSFRSYLRLGDIIGDLSNLGLSVEPDVRNIDLKSSPVYLFNVISGQLIFSKDEIKRINFEVQAMSLYYDSQYFRDIKHDYMRKRIKEGTYGY